MHKIALGLLAFAATVILLPLLGTLLGAFTGFVVGLFFEETILDFLHRAGVNTIGLPLWQVGASMGFLGGFLKTTVTNNSK
jgi:hypothetical protein